MKSTVKTIFPENIRCVAITAPAGFPDQDKLANSVKILSKMVKVKNYIAAKSSGTPGYLSADSADRLAMFNAAIRDPEVDLILAVRGGFGSVHILPGIDYETLKKRQLPLMGYSDITSLHCAMLAKDAGIPIAGSNLLQLDEVLSDKLSFASHRQALRGASDPADISRYDLAPVNLPAQSLTVKAQAYAANLTVLTSLCGTEFMPDFSGMILITEDVNEPVYKLDRMFEQLRLSGALKNLQALVFGKFTHPENNADDLNKFFENIAGKLDCPCFKNFEFGHKFPMCAVNAAHTIAISAEKKYHSVSV